MAKRKKVEPVVTRDESAEAMDAFAADEFASDVKTPTKEELEGLSALAERLLTLQNTIDSTEATLNDLKSAMFQLSTEELPQLMDEIGMQEFMLKSGQRVQVRKVIKASISAKNKAEALAWLRKTGHGDLIKNEVTAAFGRNEDKKAMRLFSTLARRGLNVTQKESVHGNTLSAFVREQMERGEVLPTDVLGVFEYRETKVTKA